MKSKMILAAVMLLCAIITSGQPSPWEWSKRAGGNKDDVSWSIALDANSNSYVLGDFSSPAMIVGNDTLVNSFYGYADIFIAKYDASGNPVWAKAVTGPSYDQGHAIATDASANVYITGRFWGATITFDTITLSKVILNTGVPQYFVAKYDSSGNVLWAKTATAINSSNGAYSICTDPSGSCYVTGFFQGSGINFDSIYIANPGGLNFFAAKFDPDGNAIWAKSSASSGLGYDSGRGIVADDAGNSYVTGNFQSTVFSIDNDTLHNTSSTGQRMDIFTVKFDPSGNVMWLKRAGWFPDEYCMGIAIDANANISVTGYFEGRQMKFGNIMLYNTDSTGTPDGFADIYFARYDSSGTLLGAVSAGGPFNDYPFGITTDLSSNTYITGWFVDSISFGTVPLAAAGWINGYIVKYDGTGNALWAITNGGFSNYSSSFNSVKINLNGSIYLAGSFKGAEVIFGSDTLASDSSFYDIFIAKLSAATGIAEPVPFAGSLNIFPNPGNGEINIIPGSMANEKSLLFIMYDLQGRNIMQQQYDTSKPIDISTLPEGLYIAVLKGKEKELRGKVMVQR